MKIPLLKWAELHYDPPPGIRTLRSWAASGQIHPEPEKVGRNIMVEQNAVRVALPTLPAVDPTISPRALAILQSTR